MTNLDSEIDQLVIQTGALSWSDRSPLGVIPTSLSTFPSLTLVGKVISLKPISHTAIEKNILHAWDFLSSLATEAKEDNKMVFIFDNMEDSSEVLDKSPWNIKGAPLFLKLWERNSTFEDIEFSTSAFWIQIHGLPFDLMNVETATCIGRSLGDLLEVDSDENSKSCKKSFVRVRVMINLHQPLVPGFTHHRSPKPPAWIQYKYERLSDYCYACGRLGYLSFYCPVKPRPPDNGRYGDKLKASPPRATRVEVLMLARSFSSQDRSFPSSLPLVGTTELSSVTTLTAHGQTHQTGSAH